MLRDEFPACPRCAAALDVDGTRLRCLACGGGLVSEVDLLEDLRSAQIAAMNDDRPRRYYQREPHVDTEVPLAPPGAYALPLETEVGCPRCGAPMAKHELYERIVDRCAEHGIWLDGSGELASILRKATARPSWWSWWTG